MAAGTGVVVTDSRGNTWTKMDDGGFTINFGGVQVWASPRSRWQFVETLAPSRYLRRALRRPAALMSDDQHPYGVRAEAPASTPWRAQLDELPARR